MGHSPAPASNRAVGIILRAEKRLRRPLGRRFFRTKEEKMKKNTKLTLAILAFLAAISLFAGLYLTTRPDAVSGTKAVTVEVVHSDKSTKAVHFQTEQEYLGALLLSEGLIKGDSGPYGLYITEVDGEVADYSEDKAYWALFDGDDYASQGVDLTVLEDGDVFKLVYTRG